MDHLSPDSLRVGGASQTSLTPSTSQLSSQGESGQGVPVPKESRSSYFSLDREHPFRVFFVQLWVMLKRNAILQLRSRKSTIAQAIVSPIAFLLLLFLLQKADNANRSKSVYHPGTYPLDGVLPCQGRDEGDPCINIMFTPNDRTERRIMQTFANINNKRTDSDLDIEDVKLDFDQKPERVYGIVPVEDAPFIYNYTLTNPNTTLFGVEFTIASDLTPNWRYQIWFNSSLMSNDSDVFSEQVLAFQRGLDEAIIAVATNASDDPEDLPDLDVTLKDWPKVPPKILGDSMVKTTGAVFFFCSQMIIFITVLNNIVAEKEQKLRDSLVMMGMKIEVYWLSQFLANTWLVLICTLVTCLLGLALRFEVFKNTNFVVLLITFMLFGLAMVAFAFFITTFCRRTSVAVLVGIFIFIIGLLFQSFIFSVAYTGYVWWDESVNDAGWIVLMFMPFFNFGKMYLDLTMLTTGRFDFLTETFVPGPGFQWDDLYNPVADELLPSYNASGRKPDVPAPVQSWYFLLMNICVYGLFTWYLDKIIPDEFGNRRSPIFFLYPSYWGIRMSKVVALDAWLQRQAGAPTGPENKDEDEDVARERQLAFDSSHECSLRICNLRKVYRQYLLTESKLDKVAVKDLCLTLKEGKCLALLGQNGAGKSTTMNILAGLTPATSGDAMLYGHSVRKEMDAIRKIMGVCPQHDVLFNDLTAREHIELYAGIKNVPASRISELVEKRLAAVRLTKVADKPAGTYSGGMKRRLSMLISTIGDPRIIFLDEPTTGMDPVNRRHVWSFIENFKRGRVIVLTTHSMEEADVLGDRISVMAHGRLRALGNSIHLKNRFGAGYRVSLVTHPQESQRLKEHVEYHLPEAALEDDSAGALIFEIPLKAMPKLPSLIRWLEDNNEMSAIEPDKKLVRAWGVSQKGLEEAFLRLIREANPHGYQGYEVDPSKEKVDPNKEKVDE